MSKPIRIGTRDSQLALYQANIVKTQLEHLGHAAVIVPIKATGDLVLNQPLYQIGITGIFTKNLDIALLNNEIDIAVHSLKDVPTQLPEGIIQAAVLKRGNVRDTLVFKQNEEFLTAKNAVIATGSLRRRAQWLNRYPTHTIVNLRGNVNSRLQKLEQNKNWNAAIFAAAGLGRINRRPENAINLNWMIPAPAQGAILIATLEENKALQTICAQLNHEETEICTTIERDFLQQLEGGCTAPIGALAVIKGDEVFFNGVLLSPDGTKKIEVSKTAKLGKHQDIARFCSAYIIERGGKRLLDAIKNKVATNKQHLVYATKKLSTNQEQLFHENIGVTSHDFITIRTNRILPSILEKPIENVVITSKNAVEALRQNFTKQQLQFKTIYCVGRRTKRSIEKHIGNVKYAAANSEKLAKYLLEHIQGKEVTYFCSNLRLDTLPSILTANAINVNEVEAYQTKFDAIKVPKKTQGVLFFSPSAVKSFKQENNQTIIAFCIGETTAKEAKKHFKNIEIAKVPTIESVIELVNHYYSVNT